MNYQVNLDNNSDLFSEMQQRIQGAFVEGCQDAKILCLEEYHQPLPSTS